MDGAEASTGIQLWLPTVAHQTSPSAIADGMNALRAALQGLNYPSAAAGTVCQCCLSFFRLAFLPLLPLWAFLSVGVFGGWFFVWLFLC